MNDVLVLGGGPNGLAAAFRLTQAGHRVTVLEAADAVGGGAVSHVFAPGFRAPLQANWVAGLDARAVQAMDLHRHGLRDLVADMGTTLLAEEPLSVAGGRTTGPDATAWATLHARLTGFAQALAPFRQMTPPHLTARGNDWGRLICTGLGLRRLGRAELRELLRLILTNAADVAEDELTDDRLRGLLAFDATLGAWLGPRSPNSLILYLNRLALGPLRWPAGGPAAVTTAMAAAARAAGVTIRTGARVARIDTGGHRATGVTLATGESLPADTILSTLPPQVTLRDLVGPRALDAGLYTRAGHIRARGGAARLFLALSALPDLRGADPRSRLVIAPSVDAVETAWNPVKYGEVPARPVIEAMIPSALASGWAPPGQHVLAATVQFAPHDPADRPAARAAMLAAAVQVLNDHLPGLKPLILHAACLMPWDLADITGNPGGNWHHAELSVEQMLFLRPSPEIARYATPLPGLWLGGAGAHPGGGITGTAGWNAAEALLRGQK